jgi:hypothetical protein
MPKKKAPQLVRIVCTEEGFEDCWVELDVAEWGYAEYLDIWSTAYPLVTMRYFEPYSTNWHITNGDGVTVKHPGRGATRITWTSIYRALGVDVSRKLGNWFATACLLAATEALAIDPKSPESNTSESAGVQETSGRDTGEDTLDIVAGVVDGETGA